MRRLRPEIVRLIELAKAAPDDGNDHAPLGFAARVMAASRRETGRSVRQLERAFLIASGAAMLVLVCCGGVLLGLERGTQPGDQLAAAAHYLAETISP